MNRGRDRSFVCFKMSKLTNIYLSFLLLLFMPPITAGTGDPLGPTEVSILSVYGEESGIDEIHLRPAVQIAVETVRSRVGRNEYHPFEFNVIHKSIDCKGYPIEGPALAASYYLQYDVTAFVGPPCTLDIISVADLAASWNIPAISGVASAVELSDKTRFTTFTRTSFLADGLASAVVATMSRYNWKRCSFISSNTGYWSIMEEALANVLQQNNIFVHFVGLEYFQNAQAAMKEAGKLGRSKCDIFILIFRSLSVRLISVTLRSQMIDTTTSKTLKLRNERYIM